jgi:hypothetical protein
VIRKILREWKLSTIQLGNLKQWKNAAIRVFILKRLKGLQEETLLWINSSDISMEKFKDYSSKNQWYSFKLKSPKRRYMVIRWKGESIVL